MRDIGVAWNDLEKFIDEQIYTLPGIDNHKEVLTVLITGSRANGTFTDTSDVDIDIVCSRSTYNKIQKAMYEKGLTPHIDQAFYYQPKEGWERYFGEKVEQPHFSITPIEFIKGQIEEYEDIPLWIWSNALIVKDPNNQFKNIIENFNGYPQDLLKQKIKHRFLLSNYWLIDGYPHNHGTSKEEMFMASLGILNGIHELYRFFYLVEGKPYPYSEKLALHAHTTELGRRFQPFLKKNIDMIIGNGCGDVDVWERFDKVIESMLYGDVSEEAREIDKACNDAMIGAGIEKEWIEAGYDNVNELLHGHLGPIP